MRPKDASVKLDNLHPDMRVALDALDRAAKEFGLPEATITCGQNGTHLEGSKHHADNLTVPGEAVDARVLDLLERFANRVRTLCARAKPRTFDVVLELPPSAVVCRDCGRRIAVTAPHLHVERDPK